MKVSNGYVCERCGVFSDHAMHQVNEKDVCMGCWIEFDYWFNNSHTKVLQKVG